MVKDNNTNHLQESHTVNHDAPETLHDAHHDLDLRGTLTSVMFLGAVMLITWFTIFILFIERI